MIEDWTNSIHQGDAFDVLAELPGESVHAVVCDPPYGLNFMGRDWDNFRRRDNEDDVGRDNVMGRLSSKAPAHGAETDMHEYQKWCRRWGDLAMDVLKPGGHILAFSGNRTHHRLFCGIEDAGFEVRDTLTYHYGGGFPKALDVAKSIDKKLDVDGEYGDPRTERDANRLKRLEENDGDSDIFSEHEEYKRPWMEDDDAVEKNSREYIPGSEEARRWDGWRTTLKPATEFIVLARKPFDGTVAENMMEHGTAALNIDGCRIKAEDNFAWEKTDIPETINRPSRDEREEPEGRAMARHSDGDGETVEPDGRYPPNVLLDEVAARRMDSEVGDTSKGSWPSKREGLGGESTYGEGAGQENLRQRSEKSAGGPSRYFYTSKASQAERTLDGKIENPHPTVKPIDLMEWLIKLVAAEEQIVLDPFTGSGTTCKAAKNLNRRFIGIEKQAKWADVARVRCGLTPHDPSNVRPDDDAQQGLEMYTDIGER